MASLLFMIGGAVVNALAFTRTNFIFSRITGHGAKECKRYDLEQEQLKNKWNEDRMKRLDFINKRLCEKNEARLYINNVDETVLKYYHIFAKRIKPLPPEPQLSYFNHPSKTQKWRTIICYSWYRYCNICPIQVP